MISERYDFDRVRACTDLLQFVSIVPESDAQIVLKAAKYQEGHEMTAFDAVHTAIAEMRAKPILGSEDAYGAIDVEHISLGDESDS